ncbi:SH3 domain-containing protein [uncultured Desulfosarcina sp.]|uniref:SH3 domain-containing protein n=1 Tax=uncultured Desulfosarcina sp. TaxID=218289 RepID=UPI0029C96640|nr:SH3 domain-containing protein [uncultured Desulfosarcina sp.]
MTENNSNGGNAKENTSIVLSKKIEDSLTAIKQIESTNSLKFVDPLRELRLSIKALQTADPLRGVRESIKALQMADPLKGLRESMGALQMVDPMRGLRDSIKAMQLTDPLKDFRVSMKALQINDPLKGLRESMGALKLVDPFIKDIRTSIKLIQSSNPLSGLRESINSLQHSFQLGEIRTQLVNLNRTIDVYRNIFKDSIPATNFEQAYQEVVSKVILAKNDYDLDEAVSIVANEIEADFNSVPNSLLSIEFYINLLISFIFFIYSMHLSAKFEDRLSNQLMNFQTVIIEKLEEVLSAQDTNTYYVVLRPVNLRLKPTTKKSKVISVLYPNQTVKLIERKGKWIKVEYFDHISGVHEHGWCYKKYLKLK